MSKEFNTNNAKSLITITIVIVVIVLIVVFAKDISKFLNSITGGLGLTGSKEKEDINKQFLSGISPLSSSSFDRLQKKAPNGSPLITVAQAHDAIEKIKDARGILFDNNEKLIGVFQGLPTQFIVSWVAKRFLVETGKDMFDFMRKNDVLFSQGFSAETLDKVVQLVNKKPLWNY